MLITTKWFVELTIPYLTKLSKMAELLLDPAIRMWVILPIVLITLLFGLLRHYITVLLRNNTNNTTKQQITDT